MDGRLPFLVLYGSVLRIALLAAFAGVVIAVAGVVRWRLVRRASRRASQRASQHAKRPGRGFPAAARDALLAVAVVAAIYAGWRRERAYADARSAECVAAMIASSQGSGDAPIVLTNTHACVLAVAAQADPGPELAILRALLDDRPYRDEASANQVLTLTERIDGCTGVTRRLLDAERYVEAAEAARRCHDHRSQHAALALQGKFDEAIAITAPAEPAVIALPSGATLIAAGRWSEAAEAAAARAAALGSSPADPAQANIARLTALHYTCVAELFRHYAGDVAAAARLRARVAARDGATCAPALAELAAPDERARLLAAPDEQAPPLPATAAIVAALASLTSPVDVPVPDPRTRALRSPAAVLADPQGQAAGHIAGQAPAFTARMWLAALAPPELHTFSLEAWRAVGHVLDGDLAAATASATAAAALAAAPPTANAPGPVHEPTDVDTYLYLPGLIALRTPSTAVAIPHDPRPTPDPEVGARLRGLYPGLLLRAGDALDRTPLHDLDALTAAEAGDGGPLARVMIGDPATWSDEAVMAVLPRITTGRDAVVRQLRWAPAPNRPTIADADHFPFNLALHAAARRDALQLAGASADAARWDEIYRRVAAVLKDRRKLAALVLWQL
jgi:hypothetical protein